MAKGIKRGNKQVYNFSLDIVEDEELIEWLAEVDVSVTKIAREGLRQYRESLKNPNKNEKDKNANGDKNTNEQMTQLIQLVQKSIESNQLMMNNVMLMMQQGLMSAASPTAPNLQQQVMMQEIIKQMAHQQYVPHEEAPTEEAQAEEEEEEISDEQWAYANEEEKRMNEDPLGAFGG